MQAKDSKHCAFSHCASGSLRQSMTRQSCISAMKKIKKGLQKINKRFCCCCCFESLTHRYRYKHARQNMNAKSHIRMEKFFTTHTQAQDVLDVKLQKEGQEATLLCSCVNNK